MLLEAIKTSDENKAYDWSKNEQWATVEEMIKSQGTQTVCFSAVILLHVVMCFSSWENT